MDLRELQRRLAALGLYRGEVDGRWGPRTHGAIEALALKERVDLDGWGAPRRLVAGQQILCRMDGIEVGEIDGLSGPQTRHAFEVYDARLANGGDSDPAVEFWRDGDTDPSFKTMHAANAATLVWPRQAQAEMEKFFGPVGAHQTQMKLPYALKIAWEPARVVGAVTCHEKVAHPAQRVLARVLDHYGVDRIKALGLDLFGGSLNVRRMRGGSAWSVHAWGAAFDFDPEHNQLKQDHLTARFARPEYEKWFELWEAEGFVSLGRARDYDWMHVQAARL